MSGYYNPYAGSFSAAHMAAAAAAAAAQQSGQVRQGNTGLKIRQKNTFRPIVIFFKLIFCLLAILIS